MGLLNAVACSGSEREAVALPLRAGHAGMGAGSEKFASERQTPQMFDVNVTTTPISIAVSLALAPPPPPALRRFGRNAFEPQNLRYLTVEQALADFVEVAVGVRAQWKVPELITCIWALVQSIILFCFIILLICRFLSRSFRGVAVLYPSMFRTCLLPFFIDFDRVVVL